MEKAIFGIMISIVVPVYNVREYIVECLESIASQDYPGAMECIIVDDCGQDDSIALAKDFIESCGSQVEFRIVRHERNKGLSAARNTGITEARGEWLYFLDSDDWINPDCISLMMKCVEEHPGVDMVTAGYIFTNHRNPFPALEGNTTLPDYSDDKAEIMELKLKQYYLPMTANNDLIRKEWLASNKLRFDKGIIHEDVPWLFRTAKCLNSLAICKHDTYNYRIREDSIMGGDSAKHIKAWRKVLRICLRNLGGPCRNRQIDYISNHYLNKIQMYSDCGGVRGLEPILTGLCLKARGKRRWQLLSYKFKSAERRLKLKHILPLYALLDMNYSEGLH